MSSRTYNTELYYQLLSSIDLRRRRYLKNSLYLYNYISSVDLVFFPACNNNNHNQFSVIKIRLFSWESLTISLIRWELNCGNFFLTPGSFFISASTQCRSLVLLSEMQWFCDLIALVFSYCIRALCSDHHCSINCMYCTYLLDSPRQCAYGYRGHSTSHRTVPGTQKIPIHFYWFASLNYYKLPQILFSSRQSKTQIVASSKISERVSVSLDIGIEYFTAVLGKDKFYAIFINKNTKHCQYKFILSTKCAESLLWINHCCKYWRKIVNMSEA